MSDSYSSTRPPHQPDGFQRTNQIGPLLAVATKPDAAATDLCRLAAHGRSRGHHVHLINAYTVAIADKDEEFAKTLSRGSINLPDGKPLSWASRLRGDRHTLSQVRGNTFFLSVVDKGRAYKLDHFLLGSTEEVLERLEQNLIAAHPGVSIVGRYSPPFRPLNAQELTEQDKAIKDSGAHIVWVGLGTPKQDYEAKRLADALPVVAVAVGAAFDFTAGTIKEAPPILTKVGFEWAYRFMKEPRRLWRRYIFGNARFIRSVVSHGRGSKATGKIEEHSSKTTTRQSKPVL